MKDRLLKVFCIVIVAIPCIVIVAIAMAFTAIVSLVYAIIKKIIFNQNGEESINELMTILESSYLKKFFNFDDK